MSQTTKNAAPITRRVRAYFAPVDRVAGKPTMFDAAQSGSFSLDAPPAPWVDLGWCTGFARKSGAKVEALQTGVPPMTSGQIRTAVEATVSLQFESWGKLQLALAAGSQQMNLLMTLGGAASNGSGGVAAAAIALNPGSSATALNVGAANIFGVGDLVAVDVDYTGQLGFVGSGASAAYVKQASDVGSDINYIRRVTLNVARVISIASGFLQLDAPLMAGTPSSAMKVSRAVGFVDQEGGGFFQEWSALFCVPGEQGERVLYHYPRLQAMQGSTETVETLAPPLERLKLQAAFRALSVIDANDGAAVICFRSYLPA